MRFKLFKEEKTFTIKSDYGVFECKASETILDAANRSKITIPHQCGMGICKSCKTVINGDSVLACQFIPSADCELEFNENLTKSEVINQENSLDLVRGSSDVTDLTPQLLNKDDGRDSKIIRESFL